MRSESPDAFPSSPVASRTQEEEVGGHGDPRRRKKGTPPESATRRGRTQLPRKVPGEIPF